MTRASPFGFPAWSSALLKIQQREASTTRPESTPARIEKLVEEFSRHDSRRDEIGREVLRLIRMRSPFHGFAKDLERNLEALRAGEITAKDVWPSVDQIRALVTQKPHPSPACKPLSLQNEFQAETMRQK